MSMNDIICDVKKVYKENTTTCSNICRTIVFALIALVWGMNNQDGIFQFTFVSLLLLSILVLYLFVDVFQYLSPVLMYRFFIYNLENGNITTKNDEEFYVLVNVKRNKIEIISFLFFVIKLMLLILEFIFLFCYIGIKS